MNKLKGGNIDNPYLQLQTFISMIIVGYFGVKIIYGIFFNLILKANYYYTLHSTMHYIVAKVKKNYRSANYFLKNFK